MDTSQCNARMCRHPFEQDMNRPILYDSVSVAGDNMVGVGAERICTAQTISKLNDEFKCYYVLHVTSIVPSVKSLEGDLSFMYRHNQQPTNW